MATPLDITALQQFSGVFPFLLVLILTYAILSKLEWFKGKDILVVIVAVIAAFTTLFSPVVVKTVALMTPWMVLFLIFMLFMLIGFMALGFNQAAITKFLESGEYAIGLWVGVTLLLIGLGSFFAVLNEETGGLEKLQQGNISGKGGAAQTQANFWQTLFHPKILGMVLVMILALFTVKYMTSNE